VIGVGIDHVDVARMRAVLVRRPALTARLFTASERADVARRVDPVPGLAARFAAKEAAMKSLGVGLGGVAFAEIEVLRRPSGAPQLVVHGRAASLASTLGVARFHLSMTHTASTAGAIVLAEGA
jgi:holo-[acyl-carrier protein] synthase